MRFLTFHIGDWMSHTWHLTPLEKAAYFAMILEEATHEKPLPYDVEKIAARINMRAHCDCIATILREYYDCVEGEEKGYSNKRVRQEIEAAKTKSLKAKASAEARWNKGSKKSNANALRAQSEGNATNNHKPITNRDTGSRAKCPSGVDKELFATFMDIRKAKDKALTERALKPIYNRIEASGRTITDVLTVCVDKGWGDWQPEWESNSKRGNNEFQDMLRGGI